MNELLFNPLPACGPGDVFFAWLLWGMLAVFFGVVVAYVWVGGDVIER